MTILAVAFYFIVLCACLVTVLNLFLLLTISKIMVEQRGLRTSHKVVQNKKKRRDNMVQSPGLVDITTPQATYDLPLQ